MTQLIDPSDSQYFTQTSDAPYDRHHYKVVYHGGECKVVKSWLEVQEIWWNTISQFVSHVEVIDIKKSKGFK